MHINAAQPPGLDGLKECERVSYERGRTSAAAVPWDSQALRIRVGGHFLNLTPAFPPISTNSNSRSFERCLDCVKVGGSRYANAGFVFRDERRRHDSDRGERSLRYVDQGPAGSTLRGGHGLDAIAANPSRK